MSAQAQCGAFTGIIPVLALFLIKFEWYWYWYLKVVFELFDGSAQPRGGSNEEQRCEYRITLSAAFGAPSKANDPRGLTTKIGKYLDVPVGNRAGGPWRLRPPPRVWETRPQ